jgi:hypothetical protein
MQEVQIKSAPAAKKAVPALRETITAIGVMSGAKCGYANVNPNSQWVLYLR